MDRNHFPLCILIPCYNNLVGLKKSLHSIRYEAGKYFIVIVDDGSDKSFSESDLLEFEGDDFPGTIIRLANNEGITSALNAGLQWINDNLTCMYVGRLDCGDICDPQRFHLQMEYLSRNTYISLLGTWCTFQKAGERVSYKYKTPVREDKIKREMYFRNVFIHPTVIYKFAVVKELGFYPSKFQHAEDYALFWNMINNFPSSILPRYLVVCEQTALGISSTHRIKQLRSRLVIVREFGRTFALKMIGMLKIQILLRVPHAFILHVKKLMSF